MYRAPAHKHVPTITQSLQSVQALWAAASPTADLYSVSGRLQRFVYFHALARFSVRRVPHVTPSAMLSRISSRLI
jgi:hypothetical protein